MVRLSSLIILPTAGNALSVATTRTQAWNQAVAQGYASTVTLLEVVPLRQHFPGREDLATKIRNANPSALTREADVQAVSANLFQAFSKPDSGKLDLAFRLWPRDRKPKSFLFLLTTAEGATELMYNWRDTHRESMLGGNLRPDYQELDDQQLLSVADVKTKTTLDSNDTRGGSAASCGALGHEGT